MIIRIPCEHVINFQRNYVRVKLEIDSKLLIGFQCSGHVHLYDEYQDSKVNIWSDCRGHF